MLSKIADAPFMLTIVDELNRAIDFFDKKNDSSMITSWLISTKSSLQDKANQLVEIMKSVVVETSENFMENEIGRISSILSIESKIKKQRAVVDDCLRKLSIVVDCCRKYNRKCGCYALCVVDTQKVYSLSGVEDYKGSWNVKYGMRQEDILDLDELINFLSEESGYEYARLLDSTLCFIHKNRLLNSQVAKTLDRVYQDNEYDYKDFTCCERKILSNYPNAKFFKFFIRLEPCELCRPAMISDPNRNIISYVFENEKLKGFTFVKVGIGFRDNEKRYV